ncbi:MAG: V4R domain-containing protein [Aquificaceae bacterium]
MAGWIEAISQIRRPQLGKEIPLLVFRAFRVFSGIYLEDTLGQKGAITLIQKAGKEFGKEVGERLKDEDLERYLIKVADFVRDAKVGLLIPVEKNKEKLVVALDECITCSGMPNIGKKICHFEAGFVAGIVEIHLGKRVRAYETKCNANGDNICEVLVELNCA